MSKEKYICETCRYSGGSCEKRRANCSIPCGDWEKPVECNHTNTMLGAIEGKPAFVCSDCKKYLPIVGEWI